MSPLLRCTQVHKSYYLGRSTLPVLRGVDMELRPGQFVSIMGASGSGKSTLLHILGGLDVPQQGQVYYRDEPMFEPEAVRRIPLGRDADAAAFRSTAGAGRPRGPARAPSVRNEKHGPTVAGPRPVTEGRGILAQLASFHEAMSMDARRNSLRNAAFGFVFQLYHLLPEFDVLENVLLPAIVGRSMSAWLGRRDEAQARAEHLLERVGLAGRRRHRPNELSGGERQRVAIARALMNQPDVLLADEPTGNLDRKTGRDVLDLLKELHSSGQAIVMVTHDREIAAEADEVVQLVDGRVK